LNLQPEITNKNAQELANLNFTKKRLETNEITFKHCLKTLKDSEKELEELLKERNTENFKAMKRTNPRFKRVLNAIDFNEKEIYKCKNALMGIFNNY
jgi:TRAP-type mannitol/chloroaromatic compound transport system substrate-binding protein